MRHDLKIGDRVKLTKLATYESEPFYVRLGEEGTVSERTASKITVKFDGERNWTFCSKSDGSIALVVAAPKKPKAPRGAQMYLGNGNHTWEDVCGQTLRLRVPGGWLYADMDIDSAAKTMVFVPVPQVVGYKV